MTSGPRPHPADQPAALEISDLTVAYGESTVLRGVSLSCAAGSVTALLGPNGAGKTSLLRAASGLIPIRTGTVRLLGQEITTLPIHKRFQMGLCHIPEGKGIFRSLTVQENLIMQAANAPNKRSFEAATEAFPVLGKRLRQRAGTMSGGEQQMLAMAAAYIRGAQVLLVDEASLGLAPLAVDRIFESLRRLRDEGTSLLLIDQFANRVLPMAQSAYVLRKGVIVYSGPAAKLSDERLFEEYLGHER